MSSLEIARLFADFVIPLPYLVAGGLIATRKLDWTTFILLLALFSLGGLLEGFAYSGGGS